MADAVDAELSETRNPDVGSRRDVGASRADLWISLTALVAAMLALPLARNSWHGPEVAAALAVSATALLARQRWAIALVVIAELMLAPTVVPRAYASNGDVTVAVTGLVATLALVPGLLAMKRAAAALVSLAGLELTLTHRRRFHAGLLAAGVLAATLPVL